MTRLTALMLAVLMVFSLAACAPSGKEPAETTASATLPVYAEVENPISFFSMSLGEDYENIGSLTAYYNDDATVYVE